MTNIGAGSDAGIAVLWDASGYVGDALIKATVRIPRDANPSNDFARTVSTLVVEGAGVRVR